jgi:hypothetical protein
MARSKNVFEKLEYDVPVPFGGKITDLHKPHGKVKSSQKRLSVKGSNVSTKGEVRGQGKVLNNKIRKAKSY